MPLNDRSQCLYFTGIIQALQLYQLGITPHREHPCRIQDIRNARRHTRRKVLSSFTKHHNHSTRHILTGMSAHALDNRQCSAIAYGKALSGTPGREELPTCGPVQHRIAKNGISVCGKTRVSWWSDNDLTTGHTFPNIIIGFTMQDQPHTRQAERTKTLTGRSLQYTGYAHPWQTCVPIATRYLTRQARANCPIVVMNLVLCHDAALTQQCLLSFNKQLLCQCRLRWSYTG